jgi:hypothetical protein
MCRDHRNTNDDSSFHGFSRVLDFCLTARRDLKGTAATGAPGMIFIASALLRCAESHLPRVDIANFNVSGVSFET